ncbi:MAG: fructose PTS transporter subunit IIA, partial [Aeromicrobium sp.]
MSSLITADLVSLDTALGEDAESVITALAQKVAGAGRATDASQLVADALAREAQSATGLPGGIAIPHCRSEAVTEPTLAFARLVPGADFGASDGAADLVFLIAAPAGGGQEHLKLLSSLARALVRPDFTAALRSAPDAAAIVALVDEVVSPAPVAETAPAAPTTSATVTRIVAVTACPTGIAHTYRAADSLTQQAAQTDGVELQVETQGSSGAKPLSPETIAAADAVIFATDVGV